MTRKRVVLVALPALMEDLVRRACLADGEIDVELSIDSVDELRTQLARCKPDVVIAAVRDGDASATVLAMLQLRPMLRVLLIALSGAVADLYELRPEQTRLGPVSPTEIVRAVRDDGAHAGAWAMMTNADLRGEG